MSGQLLSCVEFVDMYMSRLTGLKHPPFPPVPQDADFHAPQLMRDAMRELLRRYPADRVTGDIHPGDVLVYRRHGALEGGHLLIVGIRGAWHSLRVHGVHKTAVPGNVIHAWRPQW